MRRCPDSLRLLETWQSRQYSDFFRCMARLPLRNPVRGPYARSGPAIQRVPAQRVGASGTRMRVENSCPVAPAVGFFAGSVDKRKVIRRLMCTGLPLSNRPAFFVVEPTHPLDSSEAFAKLPDPQLRDATSVALSLTSQQLERRENVSLCEDRFTAGFADEIPLSARNPMKQFIAKTCEIAGPTFSRNAKDNWSIQIDRLPWDSSQGSECWSKTIGFAA